MLVNAGKSDLTIPVSPNAGDFERSNPVASYSVEHLSLYLTLGKTKGAALFGANLYGNPEVAGSLIVVSPGQSLTVLSKVMTAAPTGQTETNAPASYVGHATLQEEVMKPLDGGLFVESTELGSATSAQ